MLPKKSPMSILDVALLCIILTAAQTQNSKQLLDGVLKAYDARLAVQAPVPASPCQQDAGVGGS